MEDKIQRSEAESILDFRLRLHLDFLLRLHAEWTDHPFVQDENDIPGGCKTCWDRLDQMKED